ncbi:MAG TPA: LuxR C-terminal-related transcriptional regulator, partial [Thermomicrobiales bacterium]|nr:LuxR C-terminal-related transcriptional regulator [Thermomicrobiales bacterium]
RLARALDAMGRAADADACLQQTLDRLLEVDALDFVNLVRTAQVSLAIRRGDLSRARALVSRLQIEESLIFAIAPEYPLVTKVVLFAQSDDAEETAWADARLAQILDDPAALHWNEQTVQLMVMRALRVARTGYPERSSAILYRAVARAEQIADLRVFSDLGPAAEAMLAEFLEEYPTWAFLRERVAMLQAERARMGKRADPLGSPVVAPLPAGYAFDEQVTQREQDVLSGLQRRLTNKEIAAELSISPFTVKKHAQNIYAKLGVNSRRQAIQRAIALGLLPPPGSS